MCALSELLPRDEALAKREGARGYHHTMYFWVAISRLLAPLNVKLTHAGTDAVVTGAHLGTFIDSVTGTEYKLRITPRNKQEIAA